MSMKLKKSTSLYYDERADEYDGIYTLGKGPASISDPNIYKHDLFKSLTINVIWLNPFIIINKLYD